MQLMQVKKFRIHLTHDSTYINFIYKYESRFISFTNDCDNETMIQFLTHIKRNILFLKNDWIE